MVTTHWRSFCSALSSWLTGSCGVLSLMVSNSELQSAIVLGWGTICLTNRWVEFSPPSPHLKKVAADKSSLLIQAISNQNMKAKATWTDLNVEIVEPARSYKKLTQRKILWRNASSAAWWDPAWKKEKFRKDCWVSQIVSYNETCGGPGLSSPKLKLVAKNPKGNAPEMKSDETVDILFSPTDSEGHVKASRLASPKAKS